MSEEPLAFTGRTSCLKHKGEGWEESKGAGEECIQQKTIFEVQWTNCPVEVEKEVKQLWSDRELGNDNSYASWDMEETNAESENRYPLIQAFLESKGVTGSILIHWWW